MILLIDNYDSFTYNLYQQVSSFGQEVRVVKNDALALGAIAALKPERIILSPGPKTPADSGICIPVIKTFFESIPILGICLGHQCLAVAFGQAVVPAQRLVYGKTTTITTQGSRIMADLDPSFEVARYHSLVIDAVPEGFQATSHDAAGDIMSIEHKSLPLFGLQFHPESFLMMNTGNKIIEKFLAF
ncbi:MAG: aminodeoxychorismate/anthranilate synthase component II [Candidatus Marinimicrobia bacterium]|nr:aminodeoxychorismate/anthranilate synthase component II [Candidatus Neomarinimicrobiota bacterium]